MKERRNYNDAIVMQSQLFQTVVRALCALIICACARNPYAAETYRITRIIARPGSASTVPMDLNDRGQVVGTEWVDFSSPEGFVWEDGKAIKLIGLPEHPTAWPLALSNDGIIVGRSGMDFPPRATMWVRRSDTNFEALDLNSFLPADFAPELTEAPAISPDGRFVAASPRRPSEYFVIFEFDQSIQLVGVTRVLANSPYVADIATADGHLRITGSLYDRAAFWDLDEFRALPSSASAWASGKAINSLGQIAGMNGYPSPGIARPLYWDENQNSIDMFKGWNLSEGQALGINDKGYVVGYARGSGGPEGLGGFQSGFIWHPSSGVRLLTSLISRSDVSAINRIERAYRINNRGQILATKSNSDGSTIGILLNPENAPTLHIGLQEESIALSWATPETAFTLESSENLMGPWEPVHEIPVVLDDQKVVAIGRSPGSRFFRLRQQ